MASEFSIDRGLVHVYTGEGKGKTSAALGIALRALGWGAQVCMLQFIKGYPKIGEAMFADELGERFVLKQFAIDMSRNIDEATVSQRAESVNAAMSCAEATVMGGEYDVVILDEINGAVHFGLVEEARVLALISGKPGSVELILTGRDATPAIIDAADYAANIVRIKHPYDRGIQARKGIDY